MRYKLCVCKIGEKDTDVEILFSHTISKEMSLELQKNKKMMK